MPATKNVKHHIFRDLGYLRDGGLLLVMDMANSEVRDVAVTEPGLATAHIFEEWNYTYQDATSRAPQGKTRGMGRLFRYRLTGDGDRWTIYDWELLPRAEPEAE